MQAVNLANLIYEYMHIRQKRIYYDGFLANFASVLQYSQNEVKPGPLLGGSSYKLSPCSTPEASEARKPPHFPSWRDAALSFLTSDQMKNTIARSPWQIGRQEHNNARSTEQVISFLIYSACERPWESGNQRKTTDSLGYDPLNFLPDTLIIFSCYFYATSHFPTKLLGKSDQETVEILE